MTSVHDFKVGDLVEVLDRELEPFKIRKGNTGTVDHFTCNEYLHIKWDSPCTAPISAGWYPYHFKKIERPGKYVVLDSSHTSHTYNEALELAKKLSEKYNTDYSVVKVIGTAHTTVTNPKPVKKTEYTEEEH